MNVSIYSVEQDVRCQRGLTFVYRLYAPIDLPTLLTSLDDAYPGQLVAADERWGETTVSRRILQFRFELRFVREGEIQLLHRATADARQREEDRAAFEALLDGSPQRPSRYL